MHLYKITNLYFRFSLFYLSKIAIAHYVKISNPRRHCLLIVIQFAGSATLFSVKNYL
jgi:hypothetical protein